MPIITADLQPVLSDTIISQDEQNEYEIIVEGNASYGNKPVMGKACIVINSKQLKKKKIGKGDIVIASAIHSNWYPELMYASAIIIEKGDETSHAIALGKKLDIPVIVGATDATKKIIDGQTITCDPITRNVYHVAYPDPKEVHFDTIVMSPQKVDHRTLYEKITNTGRAYSPSSKSIIENKENPILLPENKTVKVVQNISAINIPQYKPKRITRSLYLSCFNQFKTFALSTQKQYKWGKWFGALEVGAKATGRDQFTIDCMAIGDILLDSDKKHFEKVLQRIGTQEYIEYIDLLIDECTKKPKDISEANWIARVSHKEHVKSVKISGDVDKQKLMEHPKEYKKIEHLVNKEEREDRIAAGLFALWYMTESGIKNALADTL
jgi:phosphohistidine swiveling domain-containing protein